MIVSGDGAEGRGLSRILGGLCQEPVPSPHEGGSEHRWGPASRRRGGGVKSTLDLMELVTGFEPATG